MKNTTLKYYIPEFLGVIIALLLLNLWVFVSLFLEKVDLTIGLEYAIKFISIALASLSGAYFAFKLNTTNQSKENDKVQAEKINEILLTLYMQLGVINSIKFEFRNSKDILFQAFYLNCDKHYDRSLKINIGNLSSLLVLSPETVTNIYQSQNYFWSALDFTDRRVCFYREKIESIFNEHNLRYNFNKDIIKNVFSEHLVHDAIENTDLVLIGSDNAESSILQAFVELRKLAVTKYPFFRFVDINTYQEN